MSAFKHSPHYQKWFEDVEQYWEEITYYDQLEEQYFRKHRSKRSDGKTRISDHSSQDDTEESWGQEKVHSQRS